MAVIDELRAVVAKYDKIYPYSHEVNVPKDSLRSLLAEVERLQANLRTLGFVPEASKSDLDGAVVGRVEDDRCANDQRLKALQESWRLARENEALRLAAFKAQQVLICVRDYVDWETTEKDQAMLEAIANALRPGEAGGEGKA